MPSLEIEIEMVTPTNDDPAGTNAKFYVSDHAHIGSNGEFYHGFVTKTPKLKMSDTGSGEIQMNGGSLTMTNEPNNSNHPFGGSNYSKILSDTGPYYVGVKAEGNYNLFEGQLFIQSIDSNNISCSLKSIRSTDSGPIFDTTKTGIGSVDGDAINGFIWGDVVDWEVLENSSEAGDFDTISGAAVQSVLYFYNIMTGATPTIKVNSNGSTWTGTGSVRFDARSDDDGGSDNALGAYQSTNNYSDDTQYSFSGTGVKNRFSSSGLNRTTAGRTVLEFAETMAYIMSASDTHIPRITNDKFYIIETSTVDSNKASSPPNLSFVWELGNITANDALRKACFASNFSFFIMPSQTDGNRTLFLINKANEPSTSSDYYHAISENDVLDIMIRGPEEIRSIKGNYPYYRWQNNKLIETKGSSTQFLSSTGKDISFDALISNDSQASTLTTAINAMKAIYEKPTISAKIDGFQESWRPGDRVVFNRRDEFVKVDMIIRSIEWNATEEVTTIEGEATLSPYEAT